MSLSRGTDTGGSTCAVLDWDSCGCGGRRDAQRSASVNACRCDAPLCSQLSAFALARVGERAGLMATGGQCQAFNVWDRESFASLDSHVWRRAPTPQRREPRRGELSLSRSLLWLSSALLSPHSRFACSDRAALSGRLPALS